MNNFPVLRNFFLFPFLCNERQMRSYYGITGNDIIRNIV